VISHISTELKIMSWSDAAGKLTTDVGKNVEIWKKRSGGDRKCLVDTWNSDLAVIPPAK
jgi:hypothetical protein